MYIPLAEHLRPQKLDDVVGQEHLLAKGKVLRKIIDNGKIPNMIFYGPAGVGKTTVSSIIAKQTNKVIHKLNCTTASISDIKNIIADLDTFHAPNGILLYLDEIQYFNKKQQQSLLEFTENGKITLIASTTENPYFYIYSALLSRTTVFEFKSIKPPEIVKALARAVEIFSKENNETIEASKDVINYIASSCYGDVRKSINTIELCILASPVEYSKKRVISLETAKEVTQAASSRYDRDSDQHYDIISAFQKSMRGSDPNAALHYLARLLDAGDLISACRRLMVCTCEDVGLAYPNIIPIVKACVDIATQVGMPEARIPLADAVVLVCNAPKSNSAYIGINQALSDVQAGKCGDIPRHLQNKHFDGEDAAVKGQFYKYPHDFKNHWVNQQYLPNEIKDVCYYNFGNNKTEVAFKQYWEKIKNYNRLKS